MTSRELISVTSSCYFANIKVILEVIRGQFKSTECIQPLRCGEGKRETSQLCWASPGSYLGCKAMLRPVY